MSDRDSGGTDKFIVGLTGNIATGKSVVTRMAAERGALAIDADKLVHEIMDSDPDMQAAIAVAFGPDVRRPNGRIDRKALGQIVFADADALRDLEAMIHPAVGEAINRLISESDRPLVFIEAIKLLEGRLAGMCQQIWVTRCSKQRQLDRLRVCRGLDTQSAAARIKAQPPQEDKVARADVVIDTNGYMPETETQFDRAWERLPEHVRQSLEELQAMPAPSTLPARKRSSAPPEAATEPKKATVTAAVAPKRKSPTQAKKEVPPFQLPAADLSDVEVRRARPSDIPSILLLIMKATDGEVTMKRADLLLAFSERSYFIGQVGTEVSTIMGWSIDSQAARIDQIFVHPLETTPKTGLAVVKEIESSANDHICEIVLAFIAEDGPAEIRQLFSAQGYEERDKESLPNAWQLAIEESQPDGTTFMIKILRDERLKRA